MNNFGLMTDYFYQREMRNARERSFTGILGFFAKFGSDNMKNNRL